jgi:multiple sugar transport system ATP-binding protein
MAMADRIAIMNQGRIQQIGTPLEIYYHPQNEFVGGFIGEPPMNFTRCELDWEGEKAYISSPTFKLELNETCRNSLVNYQGKRNLTLGVRPEDVRIHTASTPGSFGVQVDFVEQQGDRTIITLRMSPKETFLAQVLGDLHTETGEILHVSFDQRHIHFFDVDKGTNVLYHL